MLKARVVSLFIMVAIQFSLFTSPLQSSFAQDWHLRKPQGTLKIVDLGPVSVSVMINYAEGLVTLDRDNNWVPCLAEDWRWLDDRTIEFKLRQGVTFHNGEKFNAEAVSVNWEAYRALESPRVLSTLSLSDEMILKTIDDYTVRFALPEPDSLAFVKFRWFFQAAPEFLRKHKVREKNWLYLAEAGPWCTGPFRFVHGSLAFGKVSKKVVLEAFDGYWNPQYPKVQKVIFDNELIGNREEAMRLCRETEGQVDIVSHIRPLDTLKVAESTFAKVAKNKDTAILLGWFNQRMKGSKWWDIRLRKATNNAIDREELYKYAAKGNAYNLGGHIPPGAHGYNSDLNRYTYSIGKAKALIEDAGYLNGFKVKIITPEAWRLEAQIISKMLERVGLEVEFSVLTLPEFWTKIYIPQLEKPPEELDWDIMIFLVNDWYGHTGASFLGSFLLEESDFRWIDYDPIYEGMWKDMTHTTDNDLLENKLRGLEKYVYDKAYALFIYSPLTLYAVNKEVDFVPQKFSWLRLEETSVTQLNF